MAISGNDGSLVITTSLDTSGINKGTRSIKSEVASLAAQYKKLGLSQSDAFKKAWTEIDRTEEKTEKLGKTSKTTAKTMKDGANNIGSAFSKLGRIIASVVSVAAILNFGKATSEVAMETESAMMRLVDIYGDASIAVGNFIDANAKALGMSKASASSYASVYGNLFSVWADQATNAQLTAKYLNMTAVVASKTGRTMEDVQERIRSGLLGNTEAVEDLGIFVNVKTIEMTEAFKRIANGKSWEQLSAYEQSQVRTLAILEQATQKYGEQVAQTTSLSKSSFNAAFEDFKNTIGTVINRFLVPALQYLTQFISLFDQVLQKTFGVVGSVTEVLEEQNDSINTSATNQENFTNKIEETADASKKLLANFDEINTLNKDSTIESNNINIDPSTVSSLQLLAEEVDDIKNTSEEINSTWETFAYETIGNASYRALGNYSNSILALETSFKKLKMTYADSEIDWTGVAADKLNGAAEFYGGILTGLSGVLDIATNYRTGNTRGIWEGIGRLYSGWGMAVAQFQGEDAEAWRQLFMPITEETTNLYKGLSVEAAKALSEFQDKASDVSTYLKKLTWGKSIITAKDIKAVEDSLNDVFDVVYNRSTEVKAEALTSLTELVEQGFITDADAAEYLKQIEHIYNTQLSDFDKSRSKILEVLNKANAEERALTEDEAAYITTLIEDTNKDITATISKNAGDRTEIERILNEEYGDMNKKRLSQVIQFANQEYEERINTANQTYDETIANADRLYYDLGLIDEKKYNEIVSNAKAQREAEVKEAKQARTELVNEAQLAAGDIADTVDPETGVILSNWEILWNRSYDKIVAFKNKVKNVLDSIKQFFKDRINDIIDFFNIPINNFNTIFEAFGGKEFLGVSIPNWHINPIPKLAQGAVIPANKEFLAVLGDQKSGTNVEAPLDTIKQALAEVMAQMGNSGQDNRPIILQIDGREIARAVRSGDESLGNQTVYGGFANVY